VVEAMARKSDSRNHISQAGDAADAATVR
jgi:hypothetical protein